MNSNNDENTNVEDGGVKPQVQNEIVETENEVVETKKFGIFGKKSKDEKSQDDDNEEVKDIKADKKNISDGEIWKGDSFWYRSWGRLTGEAKAWYLLTLLLIVVGSFYIGFWYACLEPTPIDVPYVTADSYYENQAEAEALIQDYTGEDGLLTIMLIGYDVREGETIGRSDTIMLAFIDPETEQANLLSCPRDMYLSIEGVGTTKLNSAYAYGGVALTKKTLESWIDVEIDKYVAVDFNGFIAIVDALGGIDYEVEMNMVNSSEGINLAAGYQHLDGDEALQYVRFRGTANADIGRMDRQQKFLVALAEQAMSASTILKLPQIITAVNENVNTDFTLTEISNLSDLFLAVAGNEIKTDTLEGTDGRTDAGLSVLYPVTSSINAMVADMQDFSVEEPEVFVDATVDVDTEE